LFGGKADNAAPDQKPSMARSINSFFQST